MNNHQRPTPKIPLSAQKRMQLLREAMAIYDEKGIPHTFGEDLAYLENKYRGQEPEAQP